MPSSDTQFKKGHKLSAESFEKMRQSLMGRHSSPKTEFRKGKSPWNKGKHGVYSEEHRKQMSEVRKGKKLGEKNSSWKGGKPKCKECGIILSSYNNQYCQKHVRTGDRNYNWKGGVAKYKNFYSKQWRIRKLNATGSYTAEEWELLKAQYNYICPCCNKREPEIILSADHIIPLTKGGSDNIENIQPLCRRCNSKKYNKTIKY